MRKIIAGFMVFFCLFCLFGISHTYAANTNAEVISNDTKGQLTEIKDKELKSIEDYKESYGSDTYGLVAYILDKVRIYSIPFTILGVAISAIHRYVIGIRDLEAYTKGFNTMIGIITLFVICQVLPLAFAIIVKGWRG